MATLGPCCPGPLETLRRLAEDSSELASSLEAAMASAISEASALLEYFGERRRHSSSVTGAGPKAKTTAANAEDDEALERFFVTLREFSTSLEACWKEVLEQPRRLRIDSIALPAGSPAAPAAGGTGGRREESSHGAAPERSANSAEAREDVSSGARGSLKVGQGNLGALAGEAVAAARRRSRVAAPPARPAPTAAMSAATVSTIGGWEATPRGSLSAAAAEVD